MTCAHTHSVIFLIYMRFHGRIYEKYDHNILWIMSKRIMWKFYRHSHHQTSESSLTNQKREERKNKHTLRERIEDRGSIFFSSFESHKQFFERLENIFFLGLCGLYKYQANDKIAHQISKTLISFVGEAWSSSTWCCFNVRHMMNDPLNSCLNPNKPTILSAFDFVNGTFDV